MAAETRAIQGTGVRFTNGTTLAIGGAAGQATQLTPSAGGLRSASRPADVDTSPEFDAALREAGIREQETLHVDIDPAPGGVRGPSGADVAVIRPAVPSGEDGVRVVLYQDESGGLSWHFAEGARLTEEQRARAAKRGFATTTTGGVEFRIPLRAAAARKALLGGAPRGSLRGPITKAGRKVFKILVLPLVSRLLERPIESIVAPVERRFRPTIVWRPTPDSYTRGPDAAVTDWSPFDGQRTLLIVHGILSTVEGMLAGLPRGAMERWFTAYEGRVLAFNHASVSQSPEENAAFFLEEALRRAPAGRFEFDVLCHSRGGIVSRVLAERGRRLVPEINCRFSSVFFVASPNRGSILGNPEHTVDMIDLFTNALTNFEDGPVLYSIEVLLAMVKAVAHSAETRLPGVETMGTRGFVRDVLNASSVASPARYGAAAADYVPSLGRDNGWLIDRLSDKTVDRLFQEEGTRVRNDIVVPYEGVFGENGHPSFPIERPLRFNADDGVWHSGFFARRATVDRIDEHLRLPEPVEMSSGGFEDAAEAASRDAVWLDHSQSASRDPGRFQQRAHQRATFRGGDSSEDAAGPGAGRATELHRRPTIDFPDLVEEGSVTPLRVVLGAMTSAEYADGVITVELNASEVSKTIDAEISAPGFEVIGPSQQPIVVHRWAELGEDATFALRALPSGPEPATRRIVVTFWLGKTQAGAVSHFTTVAPAGDRSALGGGPQPPPEAVVLPRAPREWADLVIVVRRLDQDNVYDVSMRCQVAGEEYELRPMGRMSIDAGLTKYVADYLDPPFGRFPDPTLPDDEWDSALSKWNDGFLVVVRDLGTQLWTRLPETLQSEYLRLMDGPVVPRSISVHSDEMVLPWELVRPAGTVSGRFVEHPPLGASHVMGRWKPGLGARPQPQAFPVRHLRIVNPRYERDALPSSAEEASDLAGLLTAADVMRPVTRAALDELLGGADTQVVHFTGHGDWDGGVNADLSALRLEAGEALKAGALARNRLGAEAHPILFLNACTIGRTGLVLGRPGGFAANCLDAGWSGVVAPYWPVYDPEARAFSLAFYRKLKLGRSIGEALQELRAERPDDPTAQSYTYFGDPWARALLA